MRSGPGQLRLGAGGLLTAAAAAVPGPLPDPAAAGAKPEKRAKRPDEFGHPRRRATDVFLCLNAVVYLLNWLSKDALLLWGCKINELIVAGQMWRLVTPIFLHTHPVHFLINMHALHTLGPQVEMVSGTKRTAVVYLASGVIATIASFLLCPLPSHGASGAIFGLGAAMAVFYARHREVLGAASERGLRSLGLTAAINVAYSMVNKRIDNWGHIGGLVGGAVLSYLLGPRLLMTRARQGEPRGLLDQPPIPWLAFTAPAPPAAAAPVRAPVGVPPLPPRPPARSGDGKGRRRGAAPPEGSAPEQQQQPGASALRAEAGDSPAAGSG